MTSEQAHMLTCLDRALMFGGQTHDFQHDVVPMLLDGRAQWWGHDRGCAITELRPFPNRRELNVWLVGGNLRDCIALQPEIEDWAVRQGVTRITGIGRQGWTRVAERMGFQPYGVALRRDLAP